MTMPDSLDTTEQWRPVVAYEGWYEVSDFGRVRSVNRVVTDCRGRDLHLIGKLRALTWSTARSGKGYYTVTLSKDQTTRTRYVHQLVIEAFIGPPPLGMECLHGTNGSNDNHLSNLRYGTRQENLQERERDGTHPQRNKTHCPYGHRLELPNLVRDLWIKKNRRSCLACQRAGQRKAYAKSNSTTIDLKTLADQYYVEILQTGIGAGPQNADKTHCPHNHRLETPNLIESAMTSRGVRSCLACARAANRKQYANKHGRTVDLRVLADKCYADIMRTVQTKED